MTRLVRENRIEERMAEAAQQRIRQPQDPYHEQFCCRKELVLCTDNSGDEFAQVIEQVHADETKGTTRTFTQIRIGDTVYGLRIP